jgi:molecular chaperone Hsp33
MKKTIKRPSQKPLQIDVVLTGLIHNNSLRCAIAITTESTRSAQKRHGLDPLATLALGRAFACTALMGSGIKNDTHFVHCCIDGGGPLGPIVAEFIAPASLRGYVGHPRLIEVLKSDAVVPQTVGEAVGSVGTVTIRRGEPGQSEPYSGVSALVSGEIAQDIANYFLESEQIPTIVAAGVKLGKHGEVLGAGGILIQKVGGLEVEDGLLQEFEDKFSNDFNLSDRIAAGVTAEEIMRDLIGSEYAKVQADAIPIGFHCFCSRDRMAATLMGLGEPELRSIIADIGKLEMKCHYCAAVSNFKLDELLQH